MKRTGRALFVPLLFVAMVGQAIAPAYAATSPTLGAAATYGVLATTYNNPAAGTTVVGDVGFTTAPAIVPAGVRTNYGSSDPYAAAGTAQSTAIAALASQPCTFTFPTGAIDLATDTSHGPVGIYAPGVYCGVASSTTTIGAAGITLSGSGTYIFRLANPLTTADKSVVRLDGGATACDVWWTASSGSVLSALGADSIFKGTYLDSSGITLGSNVAWSGRALTFGGVVTTNINDTITVPTCLAPLPTPALLRVVTTVENNRGSSAVASDFNVHVTLLGVDAVGSPAIGAASPGKEYLLADTQTYVVSEEPRTGYVATFSGDCDLFGKVTLGATPKTCTITNTHILTVPTGTQYGLPRYLIIPKIKVNAVVETIGITSANAVQVPKGYGNVGWYKLGPKPGDSGSSLISGHFARKTSGWAVFNNLYKLRKGDVVNVKDSKGQLLRFIVTATKLYPYNASTSALFASDDASHLNLVTCTGTWINALKGFNKRLVIFTDLVH